jgi:O-antigen ligase
MIILIGTLIFVINHHLGYTADSFQRSFTSFGTAAEAIAEGSPRRRVGFLLLGLLGIVVIVARRPRYQLRLNGLLPWLAVGFLSWAALSLLWTADVPLAFRRLVVLGMVTIAVVAVLREFSLRDVILFITLTSLAYALIGMAAELAHGSFQPFSAQYRFSGTQHPNHQGMNLARLVLGAFCLSRMRIAGRRLFIVVAVIGCVLLVLTRSRTAFGAAMVALVFFACVRSSPLRLIAMLLSVGAIGLLALFLIQTGAISTPWQVILMGRGEVLGEGARKLSGRTELWQYLWTFVVERPMVGYGYHSFMSPERAGQMPDLVAWGVGDAHSLYMEVLLGTGAVGFVLFIGVLFGSIVRALRWVIRVRNPAHAFLAAYLVFIVVNGVMAATTIFPDAKFVGFLVLGYVVLRDPEREAGVGSVHDARSGQPWMAQHGMTRSRPSEWPPTSGVSPLDPIG